MEKIIKFAAVVTAARIIIRTIASGMAIIVAMATN